MIRLEGDSLDNKKIGRFIAAQRKQLSMTQRELAEQLNMSNRAVSKWETGEGYPDITVLPALAEILRVTVDELLAGEKNAPGLEAGNMDVNTPPGTYRVKDTREQAGYLLENGLRRFSYLYMAALGIVMLGIIASALSLRLYDRIFISTLIYALIISLIFLVIGFMFYRNICRNLKGLIDKYHTLLGDLDIDYRQLIYKKHIGFLLLYIIQTIILIGVIPLSPFMGVGYYRAFQTIFGYTTGTGRLVIDQGFCMLLCLLLYGISASAGILILTKMTVKKKSS